MMEVELFSESCEVSSVSPRISFSHDISQSDSMPIEQHHFGSSSSCDLNSRIEFDFCVSESFEIESCSAAELFSDGMILPTEVKKKKNVPFKKNGDLAPYPPLPPSNATFKKECHKERKYLNDEHEVCDKKSSSKSFWSFNRSSSSSGGSRYGRCLCPFPLLLRSNSTGSNTSVKRNALLKEGTNIKQNSQKHSSTRFSPSLRNNFQRPLLNKSHGYYGINVRVSPVLNVPSANLFGFGSIFSSNKDKSKKK
ncbi:hypothetical protein Lalb_Chr10g0091301 [Lupinus albus]|uniref:Uncharacterized protein n=1 Tax=Lupinus albus TaxID=3870 RepID=A0A6A4PTA2_LUPAL|nr:hypothetical protein Lalb_Chr10g0091301 [Lupinus albus]